MKDNLVLAKNIVKEFCNEWNIELPKIKVVNNSSYTLQNKSFGGYMPDTGEIIWVIYKRNFADALRSLIHELYHHYQNSQNLLNVDSGEDGDKIENEANAFAGVALRKIGREYPQIYEYENINEIKLNINPSLQDINKDDNFNPFDEGNNKIKTTYNIIKNNPNISLTGLLKIGSYDKHQPLKYALNKLLGQGLINSRDVINPKTKRKVRVYYAIK